MAKMELCPLNDGFFTEKDIEEFEKCSQIVFRDISFKEEDIVLVSGKQELKRVLSYLFRAGNSPEVNINSRDNWYNYISGAREVRFACLFDAQERDNAVLKAMQHIKRDTGFQTPHVLLQFKLYFDVKDGAPSHLDLGDGREVDFGFRALMLSEKYMHYLGMQASIGVQHAMEAMKMPACKYPVVCALITDAPTEYWTYYILVSSAYFDLSGWNPPDELCV